MPLTPPSRQLDASKGEKPIRLYVVANTCYVWDAADVERLRRSYHICGVLMGTLPQVAQQNLFLGLPLQLLHEEVAALVNNGLAVLVDSSVVHEKHPRQAKVDAYLDSRKHEIEQSQLQSRQFDQDKAEKVKQIYGDRIEKKRKAKALKRQREIEQERHQQQQQDREQAAANSPIGEAVAAFESLGLEPGSTKSAAQTVGDREDDGARRSTGKDLESYPYNIIIPGSSTGLTWYHPEPEGWSHATLESAARAELYVPHNTLTYTTAIPGIPSRSSYTGLKHRENVHYARMKIFQDLWQKGYFMGSGLKFGGDFLVYPGDPLRYHSHFTVTVLPSMDGEIDPIDIVSWGRLATAVKKSHLLAAWDDSAGKANYISLEWSGFG